MLRSAVFASLFVTLVLAELAPGEGCGSRLRPDELPQLLAQQAAGDYVLPGGVASVMTVPVTIHLVRRADGISALPEWRIDQAFTDANAPSERELTLARVSLSGVETVTVPEETFTGCLGDANGDSVVAVDDLIAVIQGWGTAEPAADFDDDGVVAVDDLLVVIQSWGPCH